jgi:hypothetical protein
VCCVDVYFLHVERKFSIGSHKQNYLPEVMYVREIFRVRNGSERLRKAVFV